MFNVDVYRVQCEPTVLPEPNHVMLNHLYALSIKVRLMLPTHRQVTFCIKLNVTVVFTCFTFCHLHFISYISYVCQLSF